MANRFPFRCQLQSVGVLVQVPAKKAAEAPWNGGLARDWTQGRHLPSPDRVVSKIFQFYEAVTNSVPGFGRN